MHQPNQRLASLSTTTWLPAQYREFVSCLKELSSQEQVETFRLWFRQDLWALLYVGMNRPDMLHPWLFARCKEIQAQPDGFLDLWARDHRKSSIITFGKTVQDILASHGDDPLPNWHGLEPTFGIFSHTRPIAKAFLRQIKTEFEQNGLLKDLFPDVLYARPERESPRWSEDNGLVVRRKSNPKEATIEAWGLVDGQPTGKHFNVLLWDDVVTRDSVTTPEMIKKTTEAWSLSLNLGDAAPRKRAIGTRWHFADSYRTIMDRGALLPRIHPATVDGSLKGAPVLLTQEQFDTKVRDMGPYVASAQLLLNPTVDSKQTFQRDWFRHRFDRERVNWEGMTRCLLCDPASGKKGSDFTTMALIGHGPDQNTYLLDFLRDRLTLTQRGQAYMQMHRKWRPQHAGYEEYGLQADIQYVQELMARETYHFEITPLAGKLSKGDRVNRLIPLCYDGKFWMPDVIFRTSSEGKLEDLVSVLIEQEFLPWPVPVHDDGLDVISRKFDMEDFGFPMPDVVDAREERYNRRRKVGSWMGG